MASIEEKLAVDSIIARLTDKFPSLPPAEIQRAVQTEYEALSGHPVRDYVPILAEQAAKRRLKSVGAVLKKR